MKLSELTPGQSGCITVVGGERSLRHHLLDMGLTPGTRITVRKVAPLGDPIELTLRGYELTLRKDDAAMIELADSTGLYAGSSCGACHENCFLAGKHGSQNR
jgi:Fe2+ transport system protein FeoA